MSSSRATRSSTARAGSSTTTSSNRPSTSSARTRRSTTPTRDRPAPASARLSTSSSFQDAATAIQNSSPDSFVRVNNDDQPAHDQRPAHIGDVSSPSSTSNEDPNANNVPPPALDQEQILAVITALRDRLTATETQLTNAIRHTNQLRDANERLEQHINRLETRQEEQEANPQHDDSSSSSSSASVPPNPAPPDTALILQQLVNAQRETNRLQEQVRQDNLLSRLRSTSIKFPSLKLLDQTSISTWYDLVIPLLKKPKYNSFYDPTIQDIVADGSFDADLNSALYDQLVQPASPTVKEYILSKPALQGDGIALLQDLLFTFNRPWTSRERDRHQAAWLTIRQNRNESIQFFNRCLKERKKLVTHGVPCSDDDLRLRFLMGLPAHFTAIQEQADDLPRSWKVRNIHQLPLVAQSFLDNKLDIRNLHRDHKGQDRTTPQPQSQPQQQRNSSNPTPSSITPEVQARRDAVYNAIMAGSFDLCSFLRDTPPGQCVYHFGAHPGGTSACTAIRKLFTRAAERGVHNIPLDTQLSQSYCQPTRPSPRPSPRPQATPAPPAQPQRVQQLQQPAQQPAAHITRAETPAASLQEISVDELHSTVDSLLQDDFASNISSNNHSSSQSIPYSCSLTSVSINYCDSNYNESHTKLLIDSGATHTLITNKSLFTSLQQWSDPSAQVTLADGATQTPILGSGTISAFVHSGHRITLHNCLYVPSLSTSLLSTKDFSRTKGHSVHTKLAKTIISFPFVSLYSDDSADSKLIHINLFHYNPLRSQVSANTTESSPPQQSPHHVTPEVPNPQDPDSLPSPPPPPPTIPPHWLKPKLAVTYRDKQGISHRGVLSQLSAHKHSLIIKKSRRQS